MIGDPPIAVKLVHPTVPAHVTEVVATEPKCAPCVASPVLFQKARFPRVGVALVPTAPITVPVVVIGEVPNTLSPSVMDVTVPEF